VPFGDTRVNDASPIRGALIEALAKFVKAAPRVRGIKRIAVIGSITTPKLNPKDVDVLVTLEAGADLPALATLGRKLKGATQQHNHGADIFLADTSGKYLGRTCSYKDCHPRRSCLGQHCTSQKWVCDDLEVVTLSEDLIREPPLEVWPSLVIRTALPGDLASAFARGAQIP
jgi:predicted nucleotidyltransferase